MTYGRRFRSEILLALALLIGVPIILTIVQPSWRELSREESIKTLRGSEARDFVSQKKARDYSFSIKYTQAIEQARLRGSHQLGDPLVFKKTVTVTRVRTGAVGLLFQFFFPTAYAQYYSDGGGENVIQEFDDGNASNSEFWQWTHEYSNDNVMYGYVQFYDAGGYVGVDVWNDQGPFACGTRPGGDLAFLSGALFPTLTADTMWRGMSCESHPNVINQFINRTAIEWAVNAAGVAAVGCLGASIGWFACVGASAAASYAAESVYLIFDFTLTCRADGGGGACDEKPPCDLYPSHPCCQL